MPELPEVETIRRDLEKVLLNESVTDLKVYDRRLMNQKEEARWVVNIPGQTLKAFHRKGKYFGCSGSGTGTIGVFGFRMSRAR